MKNLLIGGIILFSTIMLSADTCPNTGLWVESKSLDPQVEMGIKDVSQTYVFNDEDGYGHTECSYYDAIMYEIFEISYAPEGKVKEMRRLTPDHGLWKYTGTKCTPPGIYLYYAPSADRRKCDATFVFHGEVCTNEGTLVSPADRYYNEVLGGADKCKDQLEEAIRESQKAEYQVASNTSSKGGCALTFFID